jgi:membrane-bound lytic murein transglycosylase MltF
MWHNKYKEKLKKPRKTLRLEATMYRYSNGQISLSDFKQPVGMNLKENNRWVKKAQTIPWLEIEKRYAKKTASIYAKPEAYRKENSRSYPQTAPIPAQRPFHH